MAPRWTYSEANASRWRHVFDDLIGGTPALEVPLEGNGKSLCSLHIRISDALKWLADQSSRQATQKWSPTPASSAASATPRTAPPSNSTSKGPTTTAPSRTLTPRFALAYNQPCSDPI